MVCSFFGHKDTPGEVRPKLEATIRALITEDHVDEFLVGNNGGFDGMVFHMLERLQKEYPDIQYSMVLAYLPGEHSAPDSVDFTKTIYPEGLESVPKRFAISRRNRWMVEQSDVVVCYVKHSWGGAAQAMEYAQKKVDRVINLAEE